MPPCCATELWQMKTIEFIIIRQIELPVFSLSSTRLSSAKQAEGTAQGTPRNMHKITELITS